MNYQGEVTTAWGDGEHTFKLSVAGILELEEKCNAAFGVIFARVNGGTWTASDLLETLRLGLIGGGAKPVEAKKLVERYGLPLADNAAVARLVLLGVMFGFEAAPLGKAQAAPGEGSTNASTPQKSIVPPSLLASIQAELDGLGFGSSSP